MTSKPVKHKILGEYLISRRRGARHLRLSFTPNGQLRISVPWWASTRASFVFALKQVDWVRANRPIREVLLNGSQVCEDLKLHVGQTTLDNPVAHKLTGGNLFVDLPARWSTVGTAAQDYLHRVTDDALLEIGRASIPPRLNKLAAQHGFTYREAKIKRLNRRWGSCTADGQITINSRLTRLPVRLRDYVLLHELVHTQVMSHNSDFWRKLSETLPGWQDCRRDLKRYHPGCYLRPELIP